MYAAGGFADRYDFDMRTIRQQAKTNALCRESFPRRENFDYCKKTTSARPFAVFLGDSRAQGFYDGVVGLFGTPQPFQGAEQPLLLLARGGCPPLLNVQAPRAGPTGLRGGVE